MIEGASAAVIGALVLGGTVLLAAANGANDNFKGVATLFGSGTTDYRRALVWGTGTTFLGSLAAVFLAHGLVRAFSGRDLVPDFVASDPAFLASAILGTALTVGISAAAGIPISTTHGIVGGLVGAGLAAAGSGLSLAALSKSFFMPLLTSPLLAFAVTVSVYPLLRGVRRLCGGMRETCICVGGRLTAERPAFSAVAAAASVPQIDLVVSDAESCRALAREVYRGSFMGVEAQRAAEALHFLSAGAVSFARGLNDAPKIAALGLVAGLAGLRGSVTLVALCMAVGGILGSRRIAETLSRRITAMNHGQGLTANLVTSGLVILASSSGLPVSTTHVSCGSLFGIGLVNGRARWNIIAGIAIAWLLTLPVSAVFAAACFAALRAAR